MANPLLVTAGIKAMELGLKMAGNYINAQNKKGVATQSFDENAGPTASGPTSRTAPRRGLQRPRM